MLTLGKVWNSQRMAFCNLKYELRKKKKKKFEIWKLLVLHVWSYTMHFEASSFSKCEHIFHDYDRREKINRALVKDFLVHENNVHFSFFFCFLFPSYYHADTCSTTTTTTRKVRESSFSLAESTFFCFHDIKIKAENKWKICLNLFFFLNWNLIPPFRRSWVPWFLQIWLELKMYSIFLKAFKTETK